MIASTYTLVTEEEQLDDAMFNLMASARAIAEKQHSPVVLGCDVETVGLDPITGKLRLIQFSDGENNVIIDLFKVQDPLSVIEVLTDPTIVKLFHNAKFDYKYIKHKLGVETNNIYCTMLASQVIACGIKMPHKLSNVSERLLGITLNKEEQLSDWSGELREEQLTYAAKDVIVLPAIYHKQIELLYLNNLRSVAELEFKLIKAVSWMELNGFYLDKDKWSEVAKRKAIRRQELSEIITQELDPYGTTPECNLEGRIQPCEFLEQHGVKLESTALKELKKHAGHPMVDMLIEYKELRSLHKKLLKEHGEESSIVIDCVLELSRKAEEACRELTKYAPKKFIDLNSPKQVLEALVHYGQKNAIESLVKLTSTNEKESLAPLKGIQIIDHMLEYREMSKSEDTYGEVYFKFINPLTNRIHSNYNLLPADTGRMSSSDPNLQQVPRHEEYRSCFTASTVENDILTLDYSQIEPRILAEIANDAEFDQVFFSGEDLYYTAASLLFQKEIKDCTKNDRSKAKAIMLGIFYGKGAGSIAGEIGCTLDEAKYVLKLFKKRFSTTWTYLTNAGRKAILERTAITMMGRLRKIYLDGVCEDAIDAYLAPYGTRDYKADKEKYEQEFKLLTRGKNQGFNSPIQGTSADITKLAVIKVYEYYKDTVVLLVNVVHDELVLEVPKTISHEVCDKVEELMIEAAYEWVKRIPVKVGKDVESHWAKP